MAVLAIGGLSVGILWFSILTGGVALQDLARISDPQTDSYRACLMGMVFLLLTAAIDIYRREFMPDEMIHKIRRPKIVLTRAFRGGGLDELGERGKEKGHAPPRMGPGRHGRRSRRRGPRPRRPVDRPDSPSAPQVQR